MSPATTADGRLYWRAVLDGAERRDNGFRKLSSALLFADDNNERGPSNEQDGNLISSRCPDGQHMPVIDLDVPHRLIPSTTEGHGHLYLDVRMPWWRYVILLYGLRQAGVIERGFFWWSLRRGATFVRRPGVRKRPTDRRRYR